MHFITGGRVIMDYRLVFELNKRLNAGFVCERMLTDGLDYCDVLILTAPIHCTASIAETFLQT